MERMVVVENRSPRPVKLRECFSSPPNASYGQTIEVAPNSREEFRATIFLDNNYYSLRPTEIVVFLGDLMLDQSLISQDFVMYGKIIVDVIGDGQVVILGVHAKLTDLRRLWGFGFLGREYRGRPEVLIARCSLVES